MAGQLKLFKAFILGLILLTGAAPVAFCQTEFSLYGGLVTPHDSSTVGTDPGGLDTFGFVADWQGGASDFGLRLTRWQRLNIGWGLDFSSSEMAAEPSTLTDNALSAFGYSGRVNLLTMNAYRRWPGAGAVRPYVGAGIGFAFPGFEYESAGGRAVAGQFAGPAFQWVAGASYPLSERVSLFGEYKGNYLINNVELENGGSVRANTRLNALNVGVALGF